MVEWKMEQVLLRVKLLDCVDYDQSRCSQFWVITAHMKVFVDT